MVILYQFIIYRRNFVLEPYRGKVVNNSTFFSKATIAVSCKLILTQLMNIMSHIYKEESQIRMRIAEMYLI